MASSSACLTFLKTTSGLEMLEIEENKEGT
jgi:hypothetical protein